VYNSVLNLIKGTFRYTLKTKNAKVRYIDTTRTYRRFERTYREMLFFERMAIIGIGAAISPLFLPLHLIYDFTKIECIVKDIDPKTVGFIMSKERDHWLLYI
jgi:hypothetical protein